MHYDTTEQSEYQHTITWCGKTVELTPEDRQQLREWQKHQEEQLDPQWAELKPTAVIGYGTWVVMAGHEFILMCTQVALHVGGCVRPTGRLVWFDEMRRN